jgi:hypothetical protein
MTLEAAVHAAWEAVQAAEAQGRRDLALARLDALIIALSDLSPAAQLRWCLDHAPGPRAGGLVVRVPLLDRVLIPTLVEGVLAQAPGCARVLARQDLYAVQRRAPAGNPLLRLPPDLRHPEGLLRAALRLDPSDEAAREDLCAQVASWLRSCLHGLPTGLLYGVDGATLGQMDELDEAFATLIGQATTPELVDRYAALRADCERHLPAYRAYLECLPVDGGYPAFLGVWVGPGSGMNGD